MEPARQYPDGPESDTRRNEPRDWGGASRRHEAVEHVPVPAAPGSGGGGGGGGGGRVRPLDCGAVDADVPGRVCARVRVRGGGNMGGEGPPGRQAGRLGPGLGSG